jgi:hypothetical protein
LSGALRGRWSKDGAVVELTIDRVHLRDIRLIATTWARETEVCPLLESVARERLLKTQKAGKNLSGGCDDL